MTNLTDEKIKKYLEERRQAEEQARITSIDDIIETLRSATSHDLIWAPSPSKIYSIKRVFEDPEQTEYFVRQEQNKEKIKDLLNVIYNKFFGGEDSVVHKSMGTEYIANIVYPLALQGRLQDIPQEYLLDSITYFEQKAIDSQYDGDFVVAHGIPSHKFLWADSERSRAEQRSGKPSYDRSRQYQGKANVIRQEYELLYILPKVSVSGTQA